MSINYCAFCSKETMLDGKNTKHGDAIDKNGGRCPHRNDKDYCEHKGIVSGGKCSCGVRVS